MVNAWGDEGLRLSVGVVFREVVVDVKAAGVFRFVASTQFSRFTGTKYRY